MLFSRKKIAPTTDTVKNYYGNSNKRTPSKSDTVIEVIKQQQNHYLKLLINIMKLIENT